MRALRCAAALTLLAATAAACPLPDAATRERGIPQPPPAAGLPGALLGAAVLVAAVALSAAGCAKSAGAGSDDADSTPMAQPQPSDSPSATTGSTAQSHHSSLMRRKTFYKSMHRSKSTVDVLFDDHGAALVRSGLPTVVVHDIGELLRQFQFVVAIRDCTTATEADLVANAIVYVTASNGLALPILCALIEEEARRTSEYNLLFRGTDFASRMFRAYAKMVGAEFLRGAVQDFIEQLQARDAEAAALGAPQSFDSDTEARAAWERASRAMNRGTMNIEIDPARLDEAADEERQAVHLSTKAYTLLMCIVRSPQSVPHSLRVVAKIIAKSASKFPGRETQTVASFFSLRFLCPALVMPHRYGLMSEAPSESLRRKLTLLTKVLQNLATCQQFGKKEPFMAVMNPFIDTYGGVFQNWARELADVAPGDDAPEKVPQAVYEASLRYLTTHISVYKDKIRQLLEEWKSPLLEDYLKVMAQL
eukprot:m51a1_g4591 hypothetical protein (478) ;mRNA; f:191248-193003